MDIAPLAASLEASSMAAWLRGSTWAYPAANLVHLLGLTLLIGPIALLDLRLLGAGRRFVLVDVSAALTPWAITGLLILMSSGCLLFSADAVPLHKNPILQFKLGTIALALANAMVFRHLWTYRLADWDNRPPLAGRIQAALSLALWPAAGTLGRLLAYN
jgi:hypothetical protein